MPKCRHLEDLCSFFGWKVPQRIWVHLSFTKLLTFGLMSLPEKIQMPSSLLAALYKDHLVLLSDQETTDPAGVKKNHLPKKVTAEQLGANKKKVLLLTIHSGIEAISSPERNLINKILEACKMTIEDVAVVAYGQQKATAVQLKKDFEPVQMILFGVTAADIDLPIRFPDFKVQSYDQTSYLQSPPLSALLENSEESKVLKTKLWACLRTLFHL